jgi:hypothetical protein
MKSPRTHSTACRLTASATLALFTLSGFALAQAPAQPAPLPWTTPPGTPAAAAPAGAAAPAAQASADVPAFSQQELDQLLAPIALYPDALLAQVLMAATYPLEIVTAERWVKANPGLKDKALEDALQKQSWDASVKSVCAVPQVLTMMSEKLDWTQKLGDAFLAQQKEVMATVQNLRQKAAAQGNLKDSKEQKVVTEKVETTTVIKIEQSDPQVVYVPTYNPTVVYGSWWYPSYPPYYYYPPGYVAGGALIGFTAGVIVGGALWGNVNWGRGDVDIDVNRYNNFNKTNISNKNWQHNAEHRGQVPYKDKGTAQKYNRGTSPTAQSRDAYRGRADAQQVSARGGEGARGGDFNRGSGSIDSRGGGSQASRDMSGARSSSAFDTGSRAQTSAASNRGSSSMASSRSSSGARASSGGGARGGGGGGRGGGGRR